METKTKQISVEDIKKIQFVRNVSGASLYLHDLSEDGKEGNGVTIPPNRTVELASLVTEAARIRSKGLKRALEGIPASSGFTPQAPSLIVVDSLDDEGMSETVVRGTTMSKDAPQKAGDNFYDVARMRQELKEMEDELETLQSTTERTQMQASIEFLKGQIEKLEKTAQKGLEANVVTVAPGTTKEL